MKAILIGLAVLSLAVMSEAHLDNSHRRHKDGGHESNHDEGGRHHHRNHRHKMYERIVEACYDDVDMYCPSTEDVGLCVRANFACFSPLCIDVVNEGVKAIKHHSEHHGHGRGHRVPKEVKRACKADKNRFCGDLDGKEVRQCMFAHVSALSSQCSSALTSWVASLPPPPAFVVDACQADVASFCGGMEGFQLKLCMESHRAELSSGCHDAIVAFKHGIYSEPRTVATSPPSDSASLTLPSTDVVSQVAASNEASSFAQVESLCDSSTGPAAPEVMELVSKAYASVFDEPGYRHHGKMLIHGFVFGAMVLTMLVAAIIVIKRVRSRRRTSASRQSIPTAQVVVNPLANTVDSNAHQGRHYIVTGIPVAM